MSYRAIIVVKDKGVVKALIDLSQEPLTRRLQVDFQDYGNDITIYGATAETYPIINNRALLPIPIGVIMNEAADFQINTIDTKLKQYPSEPKQTYNNISLISTWKVNCGIATYTQFLREALEQLAQHVEVKRYVANVETPSLIHVQHEYGIFPESGMLLDQPMAIKDYPRMITWHTVFKNPKNAIAGGRQKEVIADYVAKVDATYNAHIVHSAIGKKWLLPLVKKPIYIVPHGSVVWPRIGRGPARKQLGLPAEEKLVFVFGFNAASKGYNDLIDVVNGLRKDGHNVTMIVSGAVHVDSREDPAPLERLKQTEGFKVIGHYLTEKKVNLYAEASDVLLFNYYNPRVVASTSGAVHRILGAGTPVVISDDLRSVDLTDGVNCIKYPMGDVESLKSALEMTLFEPDLASALGEGAVKLAEATSWNKVAVRILEIYKSVAQPESFNPDYYGEEYYVGKEGGERYLTAAGELKRWSYYNLTGEWLGAAHVISGIKKLFNPETMLDVGCGRGTFTGYANEAGIKAVGIDFSKWAIDNPYAKAKGLIRLGDVRKLDFPDDSFDLVFATDIMEHLYSKDSDDLDRAISEITRVTKKWVFFNIGTAASEGEYGEYFQLRKGEAVPLKWQGTAVAGHVTVMSPNWWNQKLTQNGKLKLRPLMVVEFRLSVPPDVLANWQSIFIAEKVEA